MRDPKATQSLLRELREIGVRLAMDDFGTGTSSLACLRDYPFDTIKIDRAFVGDLADSRDVLAVIHATITLVENLGMAQRRRRRGEGVPGGDPRIARLPLSRRATSSAGRFWPMRCSMRSR